MALQVNEFIHCNGLSILYTSTILECNLKVLAVFYLTYPAVLANYRPFYKYCIQH